jgi:hypothetical protein
MVHTNESPQPGDLRAGHELSDLEPRRIASFGAILAGTIILVVIVTYLLFDAFYASDRKSQPPASPLSFTPEPIPEPRLLESPGRDLKAMRAEENALLNSYAWIDREKGIARIPIGDAIDILAQRGLPARPQMSEVEKTGRSGSLPLAPSPLSSPPQRGRGKGEGERPATGQQRTQRNVR